MTTSLFRVSNITWAIKAANEPEPLVFTTIEQAADYLEAIGIADEEIDAALSEMFAQGHSRAQFGINGRFTISDDVKLKNPVGVA